VAPDIPSQQVRQTDRMRVSLVQLDVSLDRPDADRIAHAADLVRGCADSDLVVLPELWAHGAWAYDRWDEFAEPVGEDSDGPVLSAMRAAAREVRVLLHAGSLVERAADGALFNTSVVIGPDGELLATYRKIHRFGFAEGESKLISAGDDLVTLPLADRVMGVATCYDLRFPELFRLLIAKGAELLVVASSWPERRLGHWRLLAQARAVENLAYVFACNACGEHAGVRQAGHSMVVDPWGEVLAEAGEDENVLTVDVDASVVDKTRESFPALRDRRLTG
jgi:predicted amidohydrolase